MKRILSLFLCIGLLISIAPHTQAAELNSDLCPDLSSYISDPQRRTFVQQTIGYQLRHDDVVRENLTEGYSAIFFFEGCSDNMDHPELGDISYYRVSCACLVLRLDEMGYPQVVYYNGDCSTLPDRPDEYAARKEDIPGNIGPATIQDGTYELFSVLHRGSYEALQLQCLGEDAAIPAIYMTPHGYARVRATQINIHTRNVNHILKYDMWSEGCILVGDGDFSDFTAFMEAAYYGIYGDFDIDRKVGCVTLNRQYLKTKLYAMYQDEDAVDFLLADSRPLLPRKYLELCTEPEVLNLSDTLWAKRDTPIMSLPCSNETDARSIPIGSLLAEDELLPAQILTNTRNAKWLVVSLDGQTGYVYAGDFFQPTDLQRFWRKVFN